MNLINRTIIVILLLAGVLASCGLFIAILTGSIGSALQPTLTLLADSQQWLARFVCLGLLVIAALVSVLLLYLELMPSSKIRMHLKSIQGADVLLSADAIVAQLQYALDPLPGVLHVQPKVFKGKDDAVDVMLDMTTTADVDIKTKTDEVMDVTRAVLEGGLGLRVGKVQIKLEQTKPPKRGVPNLPKLDLPQLVAAKHEEANENAESSQGT